MNSRNAPLLAAVTSTLLVSLTPAFAHDGHDHDAPRAEAPARPASAEPGPGSSVDAALNRALARTRQSPGNADAWVDLGDAWMQRSRDRLDDALFAKAEAAYREALKLESNHAKAMVGMAWVANTRHDFVSGRAWAKRALEVEPRTPDAFALLGDAAVEAGDYDEAFEHYQAGLDLRPDLASYSRAAHLLWITGDARRAQVLMRKAIAAGAPHAENTAWCRAELGLMLFNQGALEPAAREIARALEEAPHHPHVLAAMGRIAMARGDLAEATRLYQHAADISPQHATLAALVDLHTSTGNTNAAEAATRRLLAFHESHHHGHSHADGAAEDHHGEEEGNAELARFLADQRRDPDHALRLAEAAYKEFRSVSTTATLAWCHHRKGQHAEAARFIRRALQWRTPDASLLYQAGKIHEALGDRVAAQRYLYQALSLNPQFHPRQAADAAASLRSLAGAHGPSPAGS